METHPLELEVIVPHFPFDLVGFPGVHLTSAFLSSIRFSFWTILRTIVVAPEYLNGQVEKDNLSESGERPAPPKKDGNCVLM